MNKNVIRLVIVIVALMISGVIAYNLTKENKKTTIQDVSNIAYVDGYEMSNTSITYENNISKFSFDICNKSNDRKVKVIYIIVNYDDNKEITLVGYIGSSLKKDEVRNVVAYAEDDITNYNSITYEILEN
jgi:uncharacterized membrane protein